MNGTEDLKDLTKVNIKSTTKWDFRVILRHELVHHAPQAVGVHIQGKKRRRLLRQEPQRRVQRTLNPHPSFSIRKLIKRHNDQELPIIAARTTERKPRETFSYRSNALSLESWCIRTIFRTTPVSFLECGGGGKHTLLHIYFFTPLPYH